MNRTLIWSAALIAALAFSAGCGDEDDGSGGGAGGAGATGGDGGTGGTDGTGGTGGVIGDEEICDDSIDNDEDGDVDCDDTDCAEHAACQPADEICDDGVDNDGDDAIDCADTDCDDSPACVETACDDGVDNDGDGATDCDDTDCEGAAACMTETVCDDGLDDDGDGDVDCDDPDCDDDAACRIEICDNGEDDNGDDLIDCADPTCATAANCSFAPGSLIITEIFFNGVGSDDGFEWIEVYNPGDMFVNLRGFKLHETWGAGYTYTIVDSFAVEPKGFAIIGGSEAAAGGADVLFPNDADHVSYANANGDQVILLDPAGEIVDEVDYRTPGFPTWLLGEAVGRSLTLDADAFDATANDQAANWCVAAEDGASWERLNNGETITEYGNPRAAVSCPVRQEICGNGLDDDLNGAADCDDGDVCADHPSCLPPESVCDDGLDDDNDGDIDCDDLDCAADPVCAGVPMARLVINEVDYDQPGEDTTEFVEIYNAGNASADLDGLAIVTINGSNSAEYGRVALSGTLAPGAFLVVGNGVTVPTGVTLIPLAGQLQNGAPDAVALVDINSQTVIDALSYEGEVGAASITGFPGTFNLVAGTPFITADTGDGSICRFPDGQNTGNDAADWILSPTPTPGAANVQ